jgi:hypothetical protein
MTAYSGLSVATQTAFAQLQDSAVSLPRTAAALHGSFVAKTVRGKKYWYFAFRDGTTIRQIYVGPDEPRVRALVERKRAAKDSDAISAQARASVAQGATTLVPAHLRLIARMSDFGFFAAGGVLVGTHAFAGYANMLGVRWTGGDKTMDVDLAIPGKNVSIALPGSPNLNLHDALSTFEAGFIPTHSDGKAGATYVLKGDPNFQVDFLTTLGRGGEKPKKIAVLGVTAQPLKFLEYVLEDPTQTVLLDRSGHYCLVNVPAPARYAVHKLIVYGEREMRFRTKARKDLDQAAALFDYFAAHGRRLLAEAWKDALKRGPGWRTRLRDGLAAMERVHPESAKAAALE